MEPLSHLIVSCSPRGWVGGQQAHLSSGPLGFAEGSFICLSLSAELPPQFLILWVFYLRRLYLSQGHDDLFLHFLLGVLHF